MRWSARSPARYAVNPSYFVIRSTLAIPLMAKQVPTNWPEFQLDGPAIWLWSLAKYVELCPVRPMPVNWESAIDLAARYLVSCLANAL